MSIYTAPILFLLITALLLGLIFWGIQRVHTDNPKHSRLERLDSLQLWLLLLAAFAVGVFLSYVLFALPSGTW